MILSAELGTKTYVCSEDDIFAGIGTAFSLGSGVASIKGSRVVVMVRVVVEGGKILARAPL